MFNKKETIKTFYGKKLKNNWKLKMDGNEAHWSL